MYSVGKWEEYISIFPKARSLDVDNFVPDSILPRGFPRRRSSLIYECLNRALISCLYHERQKEMKQNKMKKKKALLGLAQVCLSVMAGVHWSRHVTICLVSFV